MMKREDISSRNDCVVGKGSGCLLMLAAGGEPQRRGRGSNSARTRRTVRARRVIIRALATQMISCDVLSNFGKKVVGFSFSIV